MNNLIYTILIALVFFCGGVLPAEAAYFPLQSGGNVGIGNTAPGALLHVGSGGTLNNVGTGDVYIQNDLEVDGTIYGNGAGITGLSASSIAYSGITAPTKIHGINFAGYTNTWTSTLDTGVVFLIDNTDADLAADTVLLRLEYTDDGDANAIFLQARDNNADLKYQIGADGVVTMVAPNAATGTLSYLNADAFVFQGGNVGIGATDPQKLLHLQSVGGDGILIETTGVGTEPVIQLANLVRWWEISNDAGDDKFKITDAAGPTTRLVIDNTGNIGIGTTAPSARLDVQESNASNGILLNLYNTNGAAVGSWIHMLGGGGSDWDVGQDGVGFGFFSGSNRRLTIQTGGNVGIGTSAPGALLHVGSGGTLTNVGSDDVYIQNDLEVDGTIYGNGAGITGLSASNIAYSGITAPTKIHGINFAGYTNTWTSTLDTGVVFLIDNTDADLAADTVLLRLEYTDDGDANAIFLQARDNNADLKYQIGADGVVTMVAPNAATGTLSYLNADAFVFQGGNVGIGKTNPTSPLHVNSTDTVTYLTVTNSNVGATRAALIDFTKTTSTSWQAGVDISAAGTNEFFLYDNQSGRKPFQITEGGEVRLGGTDSYSGTQAMTILLAGNVGIGSTVPEELLEVQGAEGIDAELALDADDGDDAADTWFIRSTALSNDLKFLNDTNERVTFKSGGNVGIGMSAPVVLLHVGSAGTLNNVGSGDVYIQNDLEVDGTIYGNGAGITGITASSAYSSITAPTKNHGINFAGFTNVWTSTLDTGVAFYIDNTDADLAADTVLLRLEYTDDGDANAIFLQARDNNADLKFEVGNEGNVGIGMTALGGKLMVRGAGTTTGRNFQTQNSSGTPLVTMLDNGNVGIGSVSPAAPLIVLKDGLDEGTNFMMVGAFSNASDNSGVFLGYDSTETTGIVAPNSNGVSPAHLAFRSYSGSAYVERMRVTGGGNIGIGMSTPAVLLHVGTGGTLNNVGTGDVYIQNDLEVDGTIYGNGAGITGLSASSIAYSGITAPTKIHGINFAGFTNTWTSTMDGNVVFKVDNTDADLAADTTLLQLEFTDDADVNGIFFQANDNNGDMKFQVGNEGNVGIGVTALNSRLMIKGLGTTTGKNFQTQNSSGTPLVTMLDDGNVGIGTTGPSDKLEIAGRLIITTSLQNIFVTGGNTTTVCTNNIGIGPLTLENLAAAGCGSGGGNTAVGHSSLRNVTTGLGNVAVGVGAGGGIETGGENVSLGSWTNYRNTSGGDNVAIAYGALTQATQGSHNIAIGEGALGNLDVAGNNYNVAIGYAALSGVLGSTTGTHNTALGALAGDSITSGTDNILLGYNVDTPTATTSNFLNIGNTLYGDLSAGNIGIGTTAPEGRLEVQNSEGNNADLVLDADDGDDAADTWFIRSTAADNQLKFINDTNQRMVITSAGNVGIGTSTPYVGWNDAPSPGLELVGLDPSIGLRDTEGGGKRWELEGDNIGFFIWNDTDSSARFVINNNGNVGIGETNPQRLFEVQGAEGADADVVLDADDGDDAADTWFIRSTAASNDLAILNDTATNVTFKSGGNVGIGTSAPTAKLQVSAAFVSGVATLTDAATIATDASLGNLFRVTLGGNRTLGNPTNGVDGQKVTWELIQDGSGNRMLNLDTKFTFGTDIPSITLTTTASKRDFLGAIYNASADKWYVVSFVKGY